MLKKAAALFLVGASLATWLGCTTNSSTYLYAAIEASNQIVVYREDPNSGLLTVLVGSPITAGNGVQSIVIHPSKKFLYAANQNESDVSLFNIGTDGGLTEVTPRTIVGTSPNLLAMDAAGGFLYVSNSGSNTISVFSIDASSGGLTAVGAPFPVGSTPQDMKLSPSGNVLFVSIAGDPGFVEAFSNPSSGTPGASSVPAGFNPTGLVIDPSGTYLYAANFGDNSISAYTIGTNGVLSPISGPLGETFSAPLALFIDKSGKYLYMANSSTSSSNLAAYGIDAGGGLTLLTNSPFGTDSQPSFITGDTSGKYIFVGTQGAKSIESFSLDSSTGTLTLVKSFPVGSTPTSIAITP